MTLKKFIAICKRKGVIQCHVNNSLSTSEWWKFIISCPHILPADHIAWSFYELLNATSIHNNSLVNDTQMICYHILQRSKQTDCLSKYTALIKATYFESWHRIILMKLFIHVINVTDMMKRWCVNHKLMFNSIDDKNGTPKLVESNMIVNT